MRTSFEFGPILRLGLFILLVGFQFCASSVYASSLSNRTATSDFNGDGRSDILWYNSYNGYVSAWSGGDGSTNLLSYDGSVPTGSGWVIVGTGDFNGDGRADILWYNTINGYVSVWSAGNGSTNLLSYDGSVPPSSGWVIAGIGDFDGDGKSDILWYNFKTGQVSAWAAGNGSINLLAYDGAVPPSTGWVIAGIGDFNGDGKSDILWYNANSGQLSAWSGGNGSINLLNDGTLPWSTGWTIAGIGDFNGDGKSDILWYNVDTGQLSAWSGGNGNIPSLINDGTLTRGTGWTIAGIGDYNGDGRSDILWYNVITGDESVWTGGNGYLPSIIADMPVPSSSGWTITGGLHKASYIVSVPSYQTLSSTVAQACDGTNSGYVTIAPNLTFTVTSPLSVPSHCTINWNGAMLALGANVNSDMIHIFYATDVHFLGILNIDGNYKNNSGSIYQTLINMYNSNGNSFDTLMMKNAADTCLTLTGSSSNQFTYVNFNVCGQPNGAGFVNRTYQGTGVFLQASGTGGSSDNHFDTIIGTQASGQAALAILGGPSYAANRNSFDNVNLSYGYNFDISVYGMVSYTKFGNVTVSDTQAGTGNCFTDLGNIYGTPSYTSAASITATRCRNNAIEIDGNYDTFGPINVNGTLRLTSDDAGNGVYVGGAYNNFSSITSNGNATGGLRIPGLHNTFYSVVTNDNGSSGLYPFGVWFSDYGAVGNGSYNTIVNLKSGNTTTKFQTYGVLEGSSSAGHNLVENASFYNNTKAPYYLLPGSGSSIK